MIRYLLRIRGDARDAASSMNVTEEMIDIFNEEQLSEKYLLEVNPNGQVRISFYSTPPSTLSPCS
jgi:hypothetical protein